ncbi:hypothetical protein [Roseitalea sp. MMSF_3504]|uniref:DUF7507 domain-containing protein n=2 Tax=Roseitalea TaxID=1915401 RepID=UPI00273F2F68|nr:hypothetical protein [Roseitalea sp. MMSF_3504]
MRMTQQDHISRGLGERARFGRLLRTLIAAACLAGIAAPAPAQIVNEGRATGTAPGGEAGAVTGTDSVAIETETQAARLLVALSIDEGRPTIGNGASEMMVDAGDRIDYAVTVTNAGNVTLTDISVDAPGPTFNGQPAAGRWSEPVLAASSDVGSNGELSPGESWRYRASYGLTQADIDAAAQATDSVVNTVSATATDPTGVTVMPDAESEQTQLAVTTNIPSLPSLSMEKIAKNGAAVQTVGWAAGDTVTYEFTVTNTGNVTLRDVSVEDGPATFTGQGTLSPVTPESVAELAPGETAVFQASYVIEQADIDAQQPE